MYEWRHLQSDENCPNICIQMRKNKLKITPKDNFLGCAPGLQNNKRFDLMLCVQPFKPFLLLKSCLLFTGTACFQIQAQLRAANCSSLPPLSPTVASCVGSTPSVSKLK